MEEKRDNNIMEYVAAKFKERIKEMGITPYRFVNDNIETVCRPTLTRILRGKKASSITTIAYFCELLGLEIKIVKKQETEENK